ncbi:hypothetical protein HYX07_02985 [Candidatus Woesearchaeota archaeon]|nr:hypothetical protein [Candidatus Woesearchaeota archaeon]
MITENISQAQGITRIAGLELKKTGNNLIFENHEYVGKEPDTKFVYTSIKKIAEKLSIPVNVASFMCSDEENGLERNKRAFYFSKVFASDVVGPMVLSQPSHVANNIGHSSNIFIFKGHIGMHQNESDGRLLYGKVESERDSLLRPTCGAMHHVMKRLLGEEHPEELPSWDVDLIGKLEQSLNPFKQEFLQEYKRGRDELEKLSAGMKFLVGKNVEIQIGRLINLLHHNQKDVPKLVFGGITINRYKYSDTTLLTQAFLLKGSDVLDLTKIPI